MSDDVTTTLKLLRGQLQAGLAAIEELLPAARKADKNGRDVEILKQRVRQLERLPNLMTEKQYASFLGKSEDWLRKQRSRDVVTQVDPSRPQSGLSAIKGGGNFVPRWHRRGQTVMYWRKDVEAFHGDELASDSTHATH